MLRRIELDCFRMLSKLQLLRVVLLLHFSRKLRNQPSAVTSPLFGMQVLVGCMLASTPAAKTHIFPEPKLKTLKLKHRA